MKKVCLLVMCITGCTTGGDFTPKPDQDHAIDIVWHQVYGQKNDPPEIEWHHAADLWGDHDGFTYAGWKICVSDGTGLPTEFRFSATTFAHELLHERTFERTGDVDAFHWRADWNLEHVANDALWVAGL